MEEEKTGKGKEGAEADSEISRGNSAAIANTQGWEDRRGTHRYEGHACVTRAEDPQVETSGWQVD